jgi:pimeloyl-ACP methyl ester carboxylesterase
MGGGIAIEFVLAHPNASDALILVDAAVAGFQWEEGRPTAGARDQAAEAGISAAKLTWLQRPIFAPAYEHPEVARRLAEMVETYSGWHWINNDPVRGAQPPAIQQLETLRVPTLVIIGERDVLDFQRIAETLAKSIPGAVKVMMPGVGHMANMEDSERFNALVLDFLAQR